MTDKHTQGPWKISKETTKGQFVTETHIRAANDWHIALVGPCEVDANARLISAAPDLLAALEHAIRVCEASDDKTGLAFSILTQARAAIKKAKGES